MQMCNMSGVDVRGFGNKLSIYCRYTHTYLKTLFCDVCDDVNVPRLERIGTFHLRHNFYGVRTNAFQSYFMVTIIPLPVKPVGMCLVIMLKQIKVNTFITH